MTVAVNVTDATVTGVTISPLSATIVLGKTFQFRAMATYTDGSVKDVTASAAWSSVTTTVAAIGATTGLADTTGKVVGSSLITATYGSFTPNTTLFVKNNLVSIAIDEGSVAVDAGKPQQFHATGTYDTGTADVTALVTWSSSATTVAKVDGSGKATTFVPGTTNVKASFTSAAGTTNSPVVVLTVNPPALDSITVTPLNPTITLVSGSTQTINFTATGNLSDGSTVDLTSTALWTSGTAATAANPVAGVATIAAGVAPTVLVPATTIITAGSGGKNGTATLTVLADTVAPVVTLTSPTNGAELRNKALTVTGTIDDKVLDLVNVPVIILNGATIPLTVNPVTGAFSQGVMLTAGRNTLVVKATDKAGNTGSSGTKEVTVNTNKPGVVITSPLDGEMTRTQSVTISGTVTGSTSVTLNVNGATSTPTVTAGAWSATVTLPEGSNIINASAFAPGGISPTDPDFLGTAGARTIIVDTTAPVITVTSPAAGSTVNTAGVAVTGTVNDLSVSWVMLILNNGMPIVVPVSGGTFSQNITLVPPGPTNTTGSNTFIVMATDAIGNTSSTGTMTVYYDNTKPRVTVTAPLNNKMTNLAGVTVIGSTDEFLGTGNIYLNGAALPLTIAPDGSFNQTVALSTANGGANTIEVRVRDVASNTGTSGVIRVTLDTLDPDLTVDLTDPTESITIMVSSNEALTGLPTVTINPGAVSVVMTRIQTNTWVGTYGSASSAIAPNDYSVAISGTDKAGNITTKTAAFSKRSISPDGVTPATVTNSSTTVNVETNGPVTGADFSVTSHLGDPSGNAGRPSGSSVLGAMVELNGSSELQNNLSRIYIEVKYNLSEMPANTDPATLKFYYFDLTTVSWTQILPPNAGVDTARQVVWAYLTHMSTYGIFGSAASTSGPAAPVAPISNIVGPPPAAPIVGPEVTLQGLTGTRPVINAQGVVVSAGIVSTADKQASLTIPAGAKLTSSTGAALNTFTCSTVASVPTAPASNIVVAAYDFGPDGAKFSPSITLTLNFNAANLPKGVSPADLQIGFWDGSKWVILEGSSVNTATGQISAPVTHFTNYAIIGKAAPAPTTAPPVVSPTTAATSTTTAVVVPTTKPTTPSTAVVPTTPATTTATTSKPVVTTPSSQTVTTTSQTEQTGNSTSWPAVIIGIVAAIVILGLVVWLLTRRKAKTS